MVDHFTDERWADYVRGLSPLGEAAAIERHLNKGCEACNKSFRFWRTVTEKASNEASYDVNEEVVGTIRHAYRDWRRRYLLPKHARMARLIFDSFLEPLSVGVRGGNPQTRQLLQRTGQWLVDLRLEPARGKRMALVGQVLRSRKVPKVWASLAILLMSTDTLLGETSANQFGEFQLEFDQAKNLRVYIEIPGMLPIGLQLPDPDESGAAA